MEYVTKIIKSRRKTFGLEVREPGILIVRAPLVMTEGEIEQAVARHAKWIEKHMDTMQQRMEARMNVPQFTGEEIEDMADRALVRIPPRVKEFASVLGVDYGRITIRNQRTRWGSCSSKGKLNFNCLLMQVPETVMDYVIVHELCHRIEMNHSERFWKLVERVMPDYKTHRKWLKDYGNDLMGRL